MEDGSRHLKRNQAGGHDFSAILGGFGFGSGKIRDGSGWSFSG